MSKFTSAIFFILMGLSLSAFAQSDASIAALFAAQQNGSTSGTSSYGSTGGSASEQDLVQRMVEQERAKSGVKTDDKTQAYLKTSTKNPKTDSAALFLTNDSLAGAPNGRQDTLSYFIKQDTVAVDSLIGDTTIVKRMGFTSDRRHVIVKRRVVLNTAHKFGRYEISFFQTNPASLFGSTTNAINGDYPLKAGDVLVLTLWGEVEKEYSFKVNNQGKVLVEGIGLVSLNNTTLAAAEAILKQKLAKIYSGITRNRTFVNLRLETLSPVKIFLVGEVSKPGGYVFYGNTSIFQALYLAGGPNLLGSVRSIQVTRGDTTFTVDLYEYLMHGKKPEPSVLNDGDVVFLPRASVLAAVKGDVGRPAVYELKTGETVKDLIQFAGFANPTAAKQKMIVNRIQPDGRRDYVTIGTPESYAQSKDAFPMQDGDSLLVYASSEKSRDHATVIGAVKYPGTYQLKAAMSAADLIAVAGGVLDETYLGRVQVMRPLVAGGSQLLSQTLDASAAGGLALAPCDTLIVYSMKDLHTADSITISGAVLKPGRYLYQVGMTPKDLILKAGGFLPNRKREAVRVDHVRKDSRGMEVAQVKIADNYEADAGSQVELLPWDHVEVPVDPNFYRPQKVKLAGAFRSPGEYSLLQPGERMKSLIDRAGGFQDDAYLQGAQFFRNKDTIGQIGFNLVQSMNGEENDNIQLQDGDSVFVPIPKAHIRVVGEVGYPCNVLYRPGKSIAWYITQAGGFRETSDLNRVMIRYANGSVSTEYDAERDPDAGSLIIVPYKQPPEPVNWSQVATTFATVIGAVATMLMAYVSLKK